MANTRPELSRILLAARWPVGGIRSYLSSLFISEAFSDCVFTLLAPNEEGLDDYLRHQCPKSVRWIAVNGSFTGMGRAVRRTLREEKYQLLHSHGFTSALAAALPARVSGIPHVMTAHDVFLPRQFSGWNGLAKKQGIGLLFSLLDGVHCVTTDGQENIFAFFPELRHRIPKHCVISHGVDVEQIEGAIAMNVRHELEVGDKTTIFGFLGRFMAQKGFRYLVDAVQLLARSGVGPDRFRVLAVGSGGFLQEDRFRVARAGLEAYFAFWPYRPKVAPILKGINCLVMPSLWEASGLLAMEAFVASTPVIGTNCIGLRETLGDSPALTVPPENGAALATAMQDFMQIDTGAAAARFQPIAAQRFDARRAFRLLREFLTEVHSTCSSSAARLS